MGDFHSNAADASQDLKGRHALVCGGSRGIGRAAALELGRRGARVTVLARTQDDLAAVTVELRSLGSPQPAFAIADMDDRAALRDLVASLVDVRGAVHVLVNNTGGPPPGPLVLVTDDELMAAFSRHVLAAHDLVRLVLPGMRESGYGRIINVISISVREPLPNLGASNIVRAAMAAWAKTLSHELPPGVTVNSVLPGYTATERLQALAEETARSTGQDVSAVVEAWTRAVPEGRIGDPSETAAAIGFLASPAASYIRGVTLAVDGGRTRTL